MPTRQNKEKFEQITTFERRRIIGLREKDDCAIGARVQWNRSTETRVWKQWTTEGDVSVRTIDTCSAWWCTNIGFVNSSTSAAPWIACKGAFIQDPSLAKPPTAASAQSTESGKVIGTKLYFQLNHASICWAMMAVFVLDAIRGTRPEVIPFLQGIPRSFFQKDNARPHLSKTIPDFCSAKHMQLLPWPAYSPDM
ncbi:UNVERIFIED_CONTAM: hypothetical protein NCL1_09928 [Trichonephila clavipes]